MIDDDRKLFKRFADVGEHFVVGGHPSNRYSREIAITKFVVVIGLLAGAFLYLLLKSNVSYAIYFPIWSVVLIAMIFELYAILCTAEDGEGFSFSKWMRR